MTIQFEDYLHSTRDRRDEVTRREDELLDKTNQKKGVFAQHGNYWHWFPPNQDNESKITTLGQEMVDGLTEFADMLEDERSYDLTIPTGNSRLVFDYNVSETSPVIRGTWVTVKLIVDLIVDGQIWDEILLWYPEITKDDIRACLEYHLEHERD